MRDTADKLSAHGPIVNPRAGHEVEQCVRDALRAGQRTIVVICRDPHPTRIPDAALAACASSTSRVVRLGRPLPELLELQEMIGAAAGVARGRGMAPQALARLLQTAEPRQSMVLVIDDADSLPRQSLYYLAQMSDALDMHPPALQIVFAAGPVLLERLSQSDFETFRNRITFAGEVMEPSLERAQQKWEPVLYPDARLRRVSRGIAPRLRVTYNVMVILAMSCLVTIGYVASLVFSDDPIQWSAPAVKSGVQQEFAAAPGRSPSAPLDPRRSDRVIASLIDQAIAAAAAGRFEEAGRLEQAARQVARVANGAPSQQVETALVQALPPSESATAAGQPETVVKTDQFPKFAASAPRDVVPDRPINATQQAQIATVPDGAASPVAADLPAFAPIRVVLTFARDNVVRAERTAAIRQALMDAQVEVADIVAVNAQRPRPGIGYYFWSDRDAAVGVSRRLEPLLGASEPVVLPLRGRVPPPGTIEIAIP